MKTVLDEFYDETFPLLQHPARDWFQRFHSLARQSPLKELESKTDKAFIRYVLQKTWLYRVDSGIGDTIRDKNVFEVLQRKAESRRRLDELFAELIDNRPLLKEFHAKPVGHPRLDLDFVSSPSLLAWTLTERSREDHNKPHWELFARILHQLFSYDFPSEDGESLRKRVFEYKKRLRLAGPEAPDDWGDAPPP